MGYNLLPENCEPELRQDDTYEKFKAFCDWLKGVRELHLSQRQEKFLLELGIPNPKSALRGAMGITFLDKIYENGGKVIIRESDYDQIKKNLPIHWANEHGGKRLPLEWKKAYQS